MGIFDEQQVNSFLTYNLFRPNSNILFTKLGFLLLPFKFLTKMII